MAKNRVEYHVGQNDTHAFKVAPGETVMVGDLVELTGNRMVSPTGAGSKAVIGEVYSGTTGIDGIGIAGAGHSNGYEGDKGHTVTVVINKPLVYTTAGGAVSAGNRVKAGGSPNKVVPADLTGTDTPDMIVGIAIENASADGNRIIMALG